MNQPAYSPELIAWVKRTTSGQNLPEHIDPATFTHRIGALFDLPTNTPLSMPGAVGISV